MLLVEDVKKIFNELLSKENGLFFLREYGITIQAFDKSSKFSLSVPIYVGENYIPESVRAGVKKILTLQKNQILKTTLSIDEENFCVYLRYLGSTENFNSGQFIYVVEEFNYLADKWRIYLDDRDKNDLVYIHIKRS